jgi:CRP/FNR family transcriptional regulator, cyclic AMP receptor protein
MAEFSTNTPFILFALKNNPLFFEVPEDQLMGLATLSTEKNFAPGEVISPASSPGDCLCLVRKGVVEIVMGDDGVSETILHVLRENDYFGELVLLEMGERWGTARAKAASVVVYVTKKSLEDFEKQCPEAHAQIIGNLARVLAERLKENGDRMADASRFQMWEKA